MKLSLGKIVILALVLVFTLPLMAKAYMGVYLADLSSKDYKKLGIEENYGVYIKSVVEGTPAAEAGLKKGDVLMQIAAEKVYTDNQLSKMLLNYDEGERVKVLVHRDGKLKKLKLTFAAQKIPGSEKKAYIGFTMQEVSEAVQKKLELKENYGILLTEVVPEGPADNAGLMKDDVILKLDGDKLYTLGQFKKIISNHQPEDVIKIVFVRNGKSKNIEVTLGAKEVFSNDFFFPKFEMFQKAPEKMFVYKYGKENNKWIGVYVNANITVEVNDDEKTEIVQLSIEDVIEGTPAEKAGLKKGDILLKAGDIVVEEMSDLTKAINKKEIGEKLELQILRDDKKMKILVEVAERDKKNRRDKVELSMDEGDIKIMIDGEEEIHYDLHDMMDNLKDLEFFNQETIEEFQEGMKEMQLEIKDGFKDGIKEFQLEIKESGQI